MKERAVQRRPACWRSRSPPGLLSSSLPARVSHEIIADVAQARLSAAATAVVDKFIAKGSLHDIANWADKVDRSRAWGWSKPLHFINIAHGRCEFNYTRDCHDRKGEYNFCTAGALYNFTAQLGTNLAAADDADAVGAPLYPISHFNLTRVAIQFLVHFIGDIHQPLHVAHLSDAGGHYPVTFMGAKTNLHRVWDFDMILYLIKHDFGNEQRRLTSYLLSQLRPGGLFAANVTQWSNCQNDAPLAVAPSRTVDEQAGESRRRRQPAALDELALVERQQERVVEHLKVMLDQSGRQQRDDGAAAAAREHAVCPHGWAEQSIHDACNVAYKDAGPNAKLGQAYLDRAKPVLYAQLAAAGVRLANALNRLFANGQP